MDEEIEFKLLVMPEVDPVTVIEQQWLPQFRGSVSRDSVDLFNVYYDTSEKQLRQWGMGLRVRGRDGQYEQTIKTDGSSQGGLHQRPEYNIPLDDQEPDLTLFNSELFPPETDREQLTNQISAQFTTHFHRHEFAVTLPEGGEVELVVDKGIIKANDHQLPINELEIELKQGTVEPVFKLARQLAELMPVRIGVLSKAARGYMLSEGRDMAIQPLPVCMSMQDDEQIESAFLSALQIGIDHWLHHEQCYVETGSLKALRGIKTGIEVTLQAINLFLPALQCEPLLELHRQLQQLLEDWRWVDTLLGIKALKSRKGPFRKSIRKSATMQSYLKGRLEGLLRSHQPETLIADKQKVIAQITLSELAYVRPWRELDTGWQNSVNAHVRGWLAQYWSNATGAIASTDSFNIDAYLACEPSLKQMLHNGIFLSGLFEPDARKQFRAPWLDILDGIEELKVFNLLQEEMQIADVEEKDELTASAQEKQAHLLAVMEQSRLELMRSEPDWER